MLSCHFLMYQVLWTTCSDIMYMYVPHFIVDSMMWNLATAGLIDESYKPPTDLVDHGYRGARFTCIWVIRYILTFPVANRRAREDKKHFKQVHYLLDFPISLNMASTTAISSSRPESLQQLFGQAEAGFPPRFRENGWYLTVVTISLPYLTDLHNHTIPHS